MKPSEQLRHAVRRHGEAYQNDFRGGSWKLWNDIIGEIRLRYPPPQLKPGEFPCNDEAIRLLEEAGL